MTNPDNAVGTNGAYGGRTSVNALNDILGAFSKGVVSGWGCSPDSGLTVTLGGDHTERDVAIAEDNIGNKTTINNISNDGVPVTVAAAPASNSRIDAIVAYVDNPPQGQSTEIDNPGACGIISVSGNPGVSPISPDDNAIRTAITADGASGATAYYVILALITITSGTTVLASGDITQGSLSSIHADNIASGSITNDKLAYIGGNYSLSEQDTGFTWVGGETIYKKTISTGGLPNANTIQVAHSISNIDVILKLEGIAFTSAGVTIPLPYVNVVDASYNVSAYADKTNISISTGDDKTSYSSSYITLYYTKTS